jgi:hypothetical protein
VKITIEISLDGETPVVTTQAQTQTQAAHDSSDAGRAPDLAAEPPRAIAKATGTLINAGSPKPPAFDLPVGVLVATDYPAMDETEADEVEDAGPAPQVN